MKVKFDLIVLTEVGTNNILETPNLKGYRKQWELRKGKSGGGIIIWHKENLEVIRMETKFQQAEIVELTIKNKGKISTVSAIYRPPNKSIKRFIEELEAWLVKIGNKKAA